MSQLDITLPFADGEYRFALYGPQINELQRTTGHGIGSLLGRLLTGCYLDDSGAIVDADPLQGQWRDADITETIRQALIGGGGGVVDGKPVPVTAPVANALVTAYVVGAPRKPHWLIAASIVRALIEGYDPPRPAPPAGEKRRTRKAASTTPNS